jgi:hypothetical protein
MSTNDSYSEYTLSLWFQNNRASLDSNFIWVMQDDVDFVGEFTQVLSMLQISSKVDYLAPGCVASAEVASRWDSQATVEIGVEAKGSNFKGSTSSSDYCCHGSFVRYSARLLDSLHDGLIAGERTGANSFSISHALKFSFSFNDLLDIKGALEVFESPYWSRQFHHSPVWKNATDFPGEVLERFEDEYALKSSASIIFPARPVGLMFRGCA